MQVLSLSLSTEYLRRKILFFKWERRKKEESTNEGEGGKEKSTPSQQSKSQAWLQGGQRQGTGKEHLIWEFRLWKLNS